MTSFRYPAKNPAQQHIFLLFAFTLILSVAGAQGQGQTITGDLPAHIRDMRATIPGNGSEGYVPPDQNELAVWQETIAALIDGETARADSLIAQSMPFYALTAFADTSEAGQQYFILQEKPPIQRGWGTVCINLNYQRQICIEIPHPLYDLNTDVEGTDIFRRTGARFLLMAGTHRCANGDDSPCDGNFSGCGRRRYPASDMAHVVDSPFQTTHEMLRTRFPRMYFFSIHGHSRQDCEDVFLSNGHSARASPLLGRIQASLLAESGITAGAVGDGLSRCPLTAGTNVQGRASNGSPAPCTQAPFAVSGFFIHVEQSRRTRENFALYSKLIRAINANIGTVSAVQPYPTPTPASQPQRFTIVAIHPNPAPAQRRIVYRLFTTSGVRVRLYNINGQMIRELQPYLAMPEGLHQIMWDGRDGAGLPVPEGVYFVELSETSGGRARGKITVLRDF